MKPFDLIRHGCAVPLSPKGKALPSLRVISSFLIPDPRITAS